MYDVYRNTIESWSRYRVLVFMDEPVHQDGVDFYLRNAYRRDVGVEFVTIDDPIIETLDPHRYMAFYIIPQKRKYRQELRKRFKERTGQDIHIQLYSTLKKWVEEIMMRKNSLPKPEYYSDNTLQITFEVSDPSCLNEVRRIIENGLQGLGDYYGF